MLAWLAALFVARWLIPTEGAAEGLTLWIVQLVLLTALARTAWEWRFGEQRIRCDAMDAVIGLLILAQVISALSVVFGVGNSRAAINVAWEWIGSGVLIWLLRQELNSPQSIRQLCLGLSLSATVLAGYGLWQHYIGNADLIRDYDQLTTEHDRLADRLRDAQESGARFSTTEARRLESLRAEMTRQQIPLEKGLRQALEQRLKSSREPLGLFALANSFAGLLMVMGLIAAGTIESSRQPRLLLLAACLGMIGFCLVLTKSRTAWVGLLAGMSWWMLRLVVARWQSSKTSTDKIRWLRIKLGILVGLCVAGIAVGIASLTGGLDRAVLSEAPKSLRYRLEYWQATCSTIREHFWLGTGPGNFRDHYLAHKLPVSSEEISDPHNFVLDVWANAGTLGLIGLMAMVGLLASQDLNLRVRSNGEGAKNADRLSEQDSCDLLSPAFWGIGIGFPLAAAGMELVGHGFDERLVWLGAIWWGAWLIGVVWNRRLRQTSVDPIRQANWVHLPTAIEAAIVALFIHLSGAGGIAMPAITQLLWLIWAMRRACQETAIRESIEKSPSESQSSGVLAGRVSAASGALASLACAIVCLWTATMPELLCRTLLQAGDYEWEHGRAEKAQDRFLEAKQADPWAIEPTERLAELAFQRWQRSGQDSEFDEAVKRWETVIQLLPFASRTYRRLGQAWLNQFERSSSPAHAQKAAASFASAVERYPHHAALLSEWAIACDGAELPEQSRDAARRALRQDDTNLQAGHSDKQLSPDLRLRMKRLAD